MPSSGTNQSINQSISFPSLETVFAPATEFDLPFRLVRSRVI